MKVSNVTRIFKSRKGKIITGFGCGCFGCSGTLLIFIVIIGAFIFLFAPSSSSNSSIIEDNEYGAIVVKYATEMDVEPALVMAVIKAESGFNPNAVSSVGARGLMQMMPSTFGSMRDNFFPHDLYTADDLFTPEVSIKYGVKYLSEVIKKYSVTETAVASYNAGQGAVDGWLGNPSYSNDGKTLKYIPYNETRMYVETVMKYYAEYKQQSTFDPSKPPMAGNGETSQFGFIWPCPGTTIITSYWGDGRGHKGLDVSDENCYGNPIVAVQDGTVTWANHSGWGGGYGLGTYIAHGNGVSTRYAHMSSCIVTEGQKVTQGQVIGYIGNSGDSYGAHLHFEVRINDVAVDALQYLPSPQ